MYHFLISLRNHKITNNKYDHIVKDFPKERYCTPYLSLVPLKM